MFVYLRVGKNEADPDLERRIEKETKTISKVELRPWKVIIF